MAQILKIGIAAVVAAGVAMSLSSPQVMAQQKHDSNTLHKLGNAIQYPVRKAGENASVDVHRAEGRKSVVSNRHNDTKAVVTPSGAKYPIHHYTPMRQRYTHHRHHRHHRHHVMRRHTMHQTM